MDRQAWLAERRKGIGASDAAAVCGMSPYRGPLDVYLDKLGLLPEQESEPMRWGLLLEQVVETAYCQETGQPWIETRPMLRHQQYPWMLATLDRQRADGRIVELKTARTAEGWGQAGTDEVPEGYLLQVQHQMAVADVDAADVAVLIGGSDFRVYHVARRQDLIDLLIMVEAEFWQRVVSLQPPEIDWQDERTPALVQLLHRPTPDTTIDLIDGAQYADRWEECGEEIRRLEGERDRCKARLAELMGMAAIGRLPDGREVVRRETVRHAHQVKESRYITTTIRKGKR